MPKIIIIIDEYNVIVNVGADDGVHACSLFEVYEIGKEVIVDGVNYGTLDNIKATLEAKTIYPKMSLCQSDKVIKVNLNGLTDSAFLNRTTSKIAPLNIEDRETTDELSYIKDKTITVGDSVRIVDTD